MNAGYTLADLAMYNLEKMAELDKQAFEPMIGGQPPVDPNAQGAPVDPAAAGGSPMPMDPMAGGGAPAASLPPPAAAPAAPPASPSTDDMVNAVRQVMMEMGGQGGQQAGKGGKGGKDIEERMGAIEAALAQVLQALNLASPDQAVADAVSANAKQSPKGDVMSAGSGSADPGIGAMAAGPMDPNAGALMSQMNVPNTVGGVKMSSARPLDGTIRLAEALKKVRR